MNRPFESGCKFNGRHRFDSSVGRGDFVTGIGIGQVIKGT